MSVRNDEKVKMVSLCSILYSYALSRKFISKIRANTAPKGQQWEGR